MKKATFENSINVLVKAYLNNTLMHATCSACAVGNLIADALGYTFKNRYTDWFGGLQWDQCARGIDPMWGTVFITSDGYQDIYFMAYKGEAKYQIDATGYTWEQLARIEKAFESAKGETKDERMFNGLMVVVDILADIHCVSLEVKESAKLQFCK